MNLRPSMLPLIACLGFVPAVAFAPRATAVVLPEVRRHLDEAQAARSKGTGDLAMAHADVVLIGETIRWTPRFENVPASRKDGCLRALQQGLDAWERALDDSVHFVRAENGSESEIAVRFLPDPRMKGEAVAGYANWKRVIQLDGDKVQSCSYRADVQIRTSTLENDPMPLGAIRHAAMHEFGHILGLDDSPRVGDVMGPLDIDRPSTAPMPYEADAVRKLRDDAIRIRGASLKPRKL